MSAHAPDMQKLQPPFVFLGATPLGVAPKGQSRAEKRSDYASSTGRKEKRAEYEKHLTDNPIRSERIMRFVTHLRDIFDVAEPEEGEILKRGYF